MPQVLGHYLTDYTVIDNLVFLSSSSLRLKLFNLFIIYADSSHLRSAPENVRKHVDIPNCLFISSTSSKSCFQYVGVHLTELIYKNALFLAANLSIVPLKLLLTLPAASVPGLILCIAKFIDERNWNCSYRDLAKNI